MANFKTISTMRGTQLSFPVSSEEKVRTAGEPRGVVYTKRWVVEFLLDLVGYTCGEDLADRVAIEPAAGEGAFLSVMIGRLADSCERMDRSIADCSGAIVAYELDEVSAKRARMMSVQVLVDRGVTPIIAKSLADSWVIKGDYLLESMNLHADYVVGNPPYVRMEEVSEDTAGLYRRSYATMRGRADLYIGFFEAALRQLKPEGVCAFICADRWMRNQYGSELREFITSSFSVDAVVDMDSAKAFEAEVDAYPKITVIRRKAQGKTIVARVGLEASKLAPGELASDVLQSAACSDVEEKQSTVHVARFDTWFRSSEPWSCQSPEKLRLLRRLEQNFAPLEAHARVGIGVATGKDSVFITRDECLVERSRLLKLAISKDIRGGVSEWSGNYLVDPWDTDGLVDLKNFPRLKSYFEAHELALKKRHTAQKTAGGWFKTIDRINHDLTGRRKLYIADISNELNPVLDTGETYPHHNLYYIQSDSWDLEALGGILISAIGRFFVESYGVRMRGGYLRFQAQYLRRIRIPDPKVISRSQRIDLTEAFHRKDRQSATEIALSLYNIEKREGQMAFGY